MSDGTGDQTSGGTGLLHLIHAQREHIAGEQDAIRLVYRSEVVRAGSSYTLDEYVADRAPFFYRSLESIIKDMEAGYFLSAVRSTIARLPKNESFIESHFGEIVAALFAEEVIGYKRIYSKLSLLTAENSNPYKMDLLLYDPSDDPVALVLGEVKSSPKNTAETNEPPSHDQSCYADLFKSMRKYTSADVQYDLAAARDNIDQIEQGDRERVRKALLPYSGAAVRYAGFAIIDGATYDPAEAQVLRTRSSGTEFSVDLVCIEYYRDVAHSVFTSLQTTAK